MRRDQTFKGEMWKEVRGEEGKMRRGGREGGKTDGKWREPIIIKLSSLTSSTSLASRGVTTSANNATCK